MISFCKDSLLDQPAKMSLMSDGLTQELPEGRSFEERVFARFDAMDARFSVIDSRFDRMDARFDAVDIRLDGIDGRVQALEAKALDTKPIWERALAEILEVRKGVEDLNRKIDVLSQDVLQVRADQRRVDKRMDELESRVQ
jgi:archaellum component FlaC